VQHVSLNKEDWLEKQTLKLVKQCTPKKVKN
jgi:hypothetical protein